jgi:hypothetical protein
VPAKLEHEGASASDGSYRMVGMASGRWTFEFVARDGYRGIAQKIEVVAGSTETKTVTLHNPGRIRLAVDSDTTVPWIEGTAHLGRQTGGFWVVDSVPAGTLLTVRRGIGAASRIVASLALAPAQDTLLP